MELRCRAGAVCDVMCVPVKLASLGLSGLVQAILFQKVMRASWAAFGSQWSEVTPCSMSTCYQLLPTSSSHSHGAIGRQSQHPQKATSWQQHAAEGKKSNRQSRSVSASRETCRLSSWACCNLLQQRTARARLSNVGFRAPDSSTCATLQHAMFVTRSVGPSLYSASFDWNFVSQQHTTTFYCLIANMDIWHT